MSAAIEAVRAELESARDALAGAEASYDEARRLAEAAANRSYSAYEARARNVMNVERLEHALAVLEGKASEHAGIVEGTHRG